MKLKRKPRHGSMTNVLIISVLVASVITAIISSILLYFRIITNLAIYIGIGIWIVIAIGSYFGQTKG